jgi:6,7-dimethyl-8-ribityllumazine synthase
MQRKEMTKKVPARDASKLKVGIVVSRFNEDVTASMFDGACVALRAWKVKDVNVHIARVYGSFEIPFACAALIKKHHLDAVVALGCIIKGETRHDEYLAQATSYGLMRVMLDTGVPVGFGVITTNNLKQAHARSRGATNKGSEATFAALEAALSTRTQ